VLELLLKSKLIKASAGIAGGSGLIAFVIGYVDIKDRDMKEYVNIKNESIINEAQHIKENQKQILDKLIIIDNRLYNLNKEK